MALAGIEMASGVAAAVYVLIRGGRHRLVVEPGFQELEGQLSLGTMALALIFLLMAYAGWQLWRGTRLGYRLSAILFGAQVVQVVVASFQYKFMCPAGLGIGWLFDGTGVGLWFGAEWGVAFRLPFGTLQETPYVQVNVCALAACIYLLLWPRCSRGIGQVENEASSGEAGHNAVGPDGQVPPAPARR